MSTDAMTLDGRSRALLGTAALAVMLTAADTYVVVLALQDMMTGVGLGIDQLSRATPIVSGFLLGYIAILPMIGRLSDLVSRQRVLLWCLVLFGLGSVVTALSVDLPVMIAGRVLQGVGGGGLVPVTLALVADLLPRGRRGAALGMVSAIQEVGSVLGPLLGAAVLAVWSWRAIFWINALAALVLALALGVSSQVRPTRGAPRRHASRTRWLVRLGWLVGTVGWIVLVLALWAPERLTSDLTYGPPFVPYAGHTERLATPVGLWALGLLGGAVLLLVPAWWPRVRSIDVVGALLVTGALGCLVGTFASADPTTQVVGSAGWILLPVAGACVVGYLLWHRVAAHPLVERGLVRGRVPAALLVSFFVGAAIVAVVVEIPVLARLTVTNSQTIAAFVLLRFLIAVPIGALLGGMLLRRVGPAVVATPGLALAGIAILCMATWHSDALQGWLVSTLALVAAGFGIGLAVAPINDAALADSPEHVHGLASALVVVGRMLGMVVGLALLTAIGLHRFATELARYPSANGTAITAAGVVQVHTVFLGAGVGALIGSSIAWFTLGRRRIAVEPAVS